MYHDVYVDLSVSNTFPASIAGLESSAQPNSSPPTLTIGEVWAVPTLTGKDHRPEIGIYSHCIRCRWPKDFTPSWYQAGDEFVKATRTHLNLYETLELASMGSAVRMLSGMSTKFCTWAKTYGAEELFQVTPSRCLVLGKCERTGLKTAGIESERPSSPDSNHRHPRGYAKDTLHQHAIFGEFCFRELLGSNLYTRLGSRVFFWASRFGTLEELLSMYQCIRWWFDFGWRDAQGRMNGKLKGREGACVRPTFFSPIELNDLACRFAAAASLVNRWTIVFGDLLYSFFRCFVPCDVAATSHLCSVVSATCPLCGGNISCSSSKTTHPKKEDASYAGYAYVLKNPAFPCHCQFVPRSMTMSTASCCTLVMRRGDQLSFLLGFALKRTASGWNVNTCKYYSYHLLLLRLCYCQCGCKEFLCWDSSQFHFQLAPGWWSPFLGPAPTLFHFERFLRFTDIGKYLTRYWTYA